VTTGRRGETAGRREATATLRPPPSSSFSPVIPSLSPSSSSSLPPLGFSRVLGKGKKNLLPAGEDARRWGFNLCGERSGWGRDGIMGRST